MDGVNNLKTNKMQIIRIIIKVLLILSVRLSFVWAVIEFIVYLIKDTTFNWWCVWVFIISVVSSLCAVIISTIKEVNKLKETQPIKKSLFQKRLDEEMKKKQLN